MAEPLLRVENARVVYDVPGGAIRAVDGVSFTLEAGRTLALVGESGCGKTTMAKAVLGLEPLADGEILVAGKRVSGDLKGLAKRVGIVWQDPYASLDSRWRVGRSVAEPLLVNGYSRADTEARVREVMEQVGLDPSLGSRFPHQLSGGQRQRVAVARALALNPPLVLCDEPTAALDLSIRAQILNLLKDLQESLGLAYLYISHDLTTVRFIADRIAVMYLGKIVEMGDKEEVFSRPRHPYTRALLRSTPSLENLGRVPDILPGEIPDPRVRITGCNFRTRCQFAQAKCAEVEPGPTHEGGRVFFCHFPLEEGSGTEARTASEA
ncbi:MAG: ABC transporter ATP-binding protein [Fimbriimonadales bacterium]|nr:MAG: ABC transporter ATP-binding protein [Fimbriimonadales bacterium]